MKIPQGVIGLRVKTTLKEDGAAVNVSTASVKKIYFRSPAGVVKEKTADFFTNGSDGILEYVTILDDIDEAGVWDIQAYVELASGYKSFTSVDNFIVTANLA